MKRGVLIAAGSAALVVAGLSGCSSQDTSEGAATTAESPAETPTASAAAESGGGATKVTIDGQDQSVTGSVVCATMGGNVNIAIGEATTGVAAVLGEGDPPTVTSVGLGNVNGVSLGVAAGSPGAEATAQKDGNTYKISGTATGIDMANPMQPVTKPFEIEVTCP